MGIAVAYRGRFQLRRSWRSLLVIALLVGVMFGAATAAATAARRTASAYTRLAGASKAWDAMYVNYEDDGSAILSADQLLALPGVDLVHEVRYEYAALGPGTAYLADRSGRLGTSTARARLLEGRWFDADAADEAVISFALAEREDLSVGDTFPLVPTEYLDEAETREERAYVRDLLEAVPGAQLRVVGIIAAAGQFPPLVNPGVPLMQLSPAFAALPEASPNDALLVQLEEDADVDAFSAAVGELADEQGESSALVLHRSLASDVNRSLRPQIVALSALAIVLTVAAAVVGGQAVARHVELDADSDDVLGAIGMTGGQLRAIAALQWAAVAVAAGLVSVITAVLLSPLSPSGLARLAEPDRGWHVDAPASAAAAAMTFVVVLGTGIALSAWRARGQLHTSRPGSTRAWPPVVAVGFRRAFGRGSKTGRVPVWSTLAGATVGVAAVTAATVIGTTLARQLDDPERYGLRWDLEVTQYTENSLATEGPELLSDDQRLIGVATGGGGPTRIGGREVSVLAMDPVLGDVRPPLLRGKYPEAPATVAVGERTLEHLGAELGEEIELDFGAVGGAERSFRVVGVPLMPPQGFGGRLDEGLLFSVAGLDRAMGAEGAPPNTLFLEGAPNADLHAVVEDVVEHVSPQEVASTERPTTPSDLVDLGRARSMPAVFAAAMAIAGMAALAHALFVSVRRRRHETAVLRTLGFASKQFYAATLLQAFALAAAALGLGVVLGVAIGRVAWSALAASIGSSLSARVPLVQLLVLLPVAMLATVALIAVVPGRLTARARPGPALHTG